MTSHFLVPFNTWFLTGPTSRQCALYLGNKDPIREGRGVRAGLDLSVQISHQAGTDHQIGLFSGEDFSWPSAGHDSVFLQGEGGTEIWECLCGLWQESGGCSFTWLQYMICDVHLMFLLYCWELEASVFHFHSCLYSPVSSSQGLNPGLAVRPCSSFFPEVSIKFAAERVFHLFCKHTAQKIRIKSLNSNKDGKKK